MDGENLLQWSHLDLDKPPCLHCGPPQDSLNSNFSVEFNFVEPKDVNNWLTISIYSHNVTWFLHADGDLKHCVKTMTKMAIGIVPGQGVYFGNPSGLGYSRSNQNLILKKVQGIDEFWKFELEEDEEEEEDDEEE